MLKFETTIDKGKNFTAANLIDKFARENEIEKVNYFGTQLLIDGHYYGYDHYQVIDNGNGTETVIVYLALKSKG